MGLILHFAELMISVEHVVHNFGFLGKVMVRVTKSFTSVDFIGNGNFGPRDS